MIHLDDLLAAAAQLGARTVGPVRSRAFDGFSYDSRNLRPGELFLAVRTEKADGHHFIPDACRRGAAGILCERVDALSACDGDTGATVLQVRDTRQALIAWAGYVLRRYAPRVVGIAGSVGKTSTQKAIVSILAPAFGAPAVFDNDNLNDLYGLPIALGRLEPHHQLAILELAADQPGDLDRLAWLVRPEVAVVTNVRPVLLKYLGSVERAAQEIERVVAALPAAGCFVANADDPLVARMAPPAGCRRLTVGLSPDAEVRATDIGPPSPTGRPGDGAALTPRPSPRGRGVGGEGRPVGDEGDGVDDGVTFTVVCRGRSRPVRLALPGRHGVANALAAIGVGLALGLDLEEVAAGLGRLRPIRGRLCPLPGADGSHLLDDTFSASPPSVEAALDVLREAPGRRVAVFGDVLGLGRDERAVHEDVGRRVATAADRLVTLGEHAEGIARGAIAAGLDPAAVAITHAVDDAVAAIGSLGSDDTVLVKGSEEARMERVVARLLAASVAPEEVLVRQTPGWRQRVFLSQERPTWVEIDLGAVGENVRRIKEIVGNRVGILAVVKADAYGHGAIRVARTALLHGATMVGTACLSEAVALRERGITAPILILGYTPPWQAPDVVRHGLTATVFSLEVARHLSRAALALGRAPMPVHVKVDSGMGRLGLLPDDVVPFVRELRALPGLVVEGIFSHFATADAADRSHVESQLATFRRILDDLERAGLRPPVVHAANSAATLTLPEAHFDLVRAGIAMHGLDPSPEVRLPPGFRPSLSFKTQVAQVKWLPPGSCVSYGCHYRTPRGSAIAVIPVGYGDGFRRAPRHWGEVLVHGRRAPIVGVVCMDMAMIDVTGIPGVEAGDEVVLIGRQGGEAITVEDVARRLGTINYEVVTQILARVPREVAPDR